MDGSAQDGDGRSARNGSATPGWGSSTDSARCLHRGRRVLIVEDEVGVAELLRELLAGSGAEASVMHNVRDAVAAIRSRTLKPEAVFLDYALPGGDAGDVVEELSRASVGAGVVLVTGQPEAVACDAAVRLRADAVVLKPVRRSVLLRALDYALDAMRRRTQPLELREAGARLLRRPVDTERVFQLLLALLGVNKLAPALRRTLTMYLRGFTNSGIADAEAISESRVRAYFADAMHRIGVEERCGFVRVLAERTTEAFARAERMEGGDPRPWLERMEKALADPR